jgi:hypothetical protein
MKGFSLMMVFWAIMGILLMILTVVIIQKLGPTPAGILGAGLG